MSKIISVFLFCITLFCLIITIFLSQDISAGILNGIQLCLTSLIPSLYFFMILSNFILNTKLRNIISRPFRWIGKTVFRIDDSLFSVFLLSMIGGYPVGAKLIADQIKNGGISSETGEYMLNFCINCSPAFLICYLSVTLWKNISIGLILYGAQVLSCFVIAFITGRKRNVSFLKQAPEKNKMSCSSALVWSVNHATKAMVVICSFVVLFCGLFPLTEKLTFHRIFRCVFRGLSEVTSGCQELSSLPAYPAILLASLFTSFGGICVFLQIAVLLSGCQIRFYRWILIRIPYMILSVFFTYLGIKTLKPAIPVFSSSEPMTVKLFTASPAAFGGMLIISGMLLLMFSGSENIQISSMPLSFRNFRSRKP